MSQDFGTPIAPAPLESPKKSNTGLIVGIVIAVVLLLCCCCAGVSYYVYNNGDTIMHSLGIY
jgi:CDP-diglyceride synthetase